MSDSTFKTWGLDEEPLTIEYSLVVLEEIRHEVNQGLQRIARGGIEVGGALYGIHDGRKIRIEAMRPIACSHAQGPAFILSSEDRAVLEEQLREDLSDAHLESLVCVGWFVSHNRGELALTDSDVELFTSFFPQSWQVTLLVRPGRATSTHAGFFVRETGGMVKADQAYQELDFPDRLAGMLDRTSRKERSGRETRRGFRELPAMASPPGPVSIRPPQTPNFDSFNYGDSFASEGQLPLPPPGRGVGAFRKWLIAMIALVVVVVGGAGFVLYQAGYFKPAKAATIGLAMTERSGQLQIEWNAYSAPVMSALKGELEIVDGGQSQVIPLIVGDLQKGQYTYTRKSGDIEVRLNVRGADNVPVSEASRFLGQAPAAPAKVEMAVLDDKKASLEAEIARLKATNAAQADRIQQLQRTLVVMQTRLDIQTPAEPAR